MGGSPLAFAGGLLPDHCERRVDDLYEARGLTTVDNLAGRYVLTIRCRGVHQIYVRVPSAIELESFIGKSVRARYRYVDQENAASRCVRAPCPPASERVLDIVELEEVPVGSGPKP